MGETSELQQLLQELDLAPFFSGLMTNGPLPWIWISNRSTGAVTHVSPEQLHGFGMGGPYGEACMWRIESPRRSGDQYKFKTEPLTYERWPQGIRSVLDEP